MKRSVGWDKAAPAADGPPPFPARGPALAARAGPTLLLKYSANAVAASLPDGNISPYSNSPTVSFSPVRTPAVDPPVLSAVSENVSTSDSTLGSSFANWQTM